MMQRNFSGFCFSKTSSCLFPAAAAAASTTILPTLSTSSRNIAVFSQQSDVLANCAKYKGYQSNVWWEDNDLWFLKRISPLKEKQRPIQIFHDRRVELYNLSQLNPSKIPSEVLSKLEKAEKEAQAQAQSQNNNNQSQQDQDFVEHFSFRTEMPYSPAFQARLEELKTSHGFKSRWWLTAREAYKRFGTSPFRGGSASSGSSKPIALLVKGPLNVYNADQFQNPELVSRTPLSGLSKKPFASDLTSFLLEQTKNQEDLLNKSGLFFTPKQLKMFGLDNLVKPEATPFEYSFSNNANKKNQSSTTSSSSTTSTKIYNVSDLENEKGILQDLQRFPVEEHTFLISGKKVPQEISALIENQQNEKQSSSSSDNNNGSKYWIGHNEIARRGFTLKQDAIGVDTSSVNLSSSSSSSKKKKHSSDADQNKVLLYHVYQLTEPDLGFRMAGTMVAA